MAVITEILDKLYAIENLAAPAAAQNIDANFDALFRILRTVVDAVNALDDGGSGAGNALLDGDVHIDTAAATPVRGDLVVANSAGKWDREAKGTLGQFLKMGADDPGWATLDASALPAHNLLGTQHGDTIAASPQPGALIVGGGGTSSIDASKYWADGQAYSFLSEDDDWSAEDAWLDGGSGGQVADVSGVSSSSWERVLIGPVNTVPRSTGDAIEWVDLSSATGSAQAKAYRSSNLSVASDVVTAIPLSAAEFDNGGFWDAASPSRFTVQDAGVYLVVAQITLEKSAVGLAFLHIYVNGGERASNQADHQDTSLTSAYDAKQVAAILSLAAGNYVELAVRLVTLTGSADVIKGGQYSTWLSIARL